MALFPLEHPLASNGAHSASAGLAYVSLAAIPLLAAVGLRRDGRRGAALASVAAGVGCLLVLAGAYAMHLDGREFECPTGSFVYVPAGTVHTFRTLEEGSRKLNLYTPAGMVGYFDELAAGIAGGMGDAELDAIAGRYQMDVVGPVPEGYL